MVGCGGGTSAPPPPAGDFTISANPTSLVVDGGASQTVTVSIAAVNAFATSVNISVSGLPAGVTASPSTFSLTPGSGAQQKVTFAAGASAQTATATLTFQGVSGSLSHSAQVSLSVVLPVTAAHAPIRTRYLRTDSYYDPNSLQYAPPRFTAYDPATKRFFVSNPYLNEIDVFDATKKLEIGQISVPMAWGLDISPYNGNLYAGTLVGDVYRIDTSKLSVVNRYPFASIGPNGFRATTALVLFDGRLALQGAAGGILGVDGFAAPVVWDTESNSLDTGKYDEGVCPSSNGAFALSGDRKLILGTWVDEGGGGDVICSYDPIAKVATYGNFPYSTFVRQIIPTPDGKRFFLTSNQNGVGVFDARTVQLIGQITGPDSGPELPNAAAGAVMSLDGKTLYLVDQGTGAVATYDTTSLAQTGWIPSFIVNDVEREIVISAIDETGLIVGPTGHGVAFIDASQFSMAQPTMFNPGYASVATGPLAGGTVTNDFTVAGITDNASLSQMFVGNVPGADQSFSARPGYENSAQVTTPPSNLTGAVDLTTVLSDGGVGVTPENFSYGPTILEIIPNGATAEGGQTGAIIGYGFGDSLSGVQVTVGGRATTVTAVYPSAPVGPYPFPVNGLQFRIPPGTVGSAVDVTVTTPSGTATAAGGFHYTAPVEAYPLRASLQAGIYDPHRDLYYFADKQQIQVLSRTQGKWLSPIALPGVGSKTQLLAISESPDDSTLAVSDYGGQAIYVLNPDNPASAKKYPMSLDKDSFSALIAPDGLAMTNEGIVYFDTADIGGTGTPALHKLDIAKGTIIDIGYSILGISSGGEGDQLDRVILSPDGSRVYTDIEAVSYLLETASDRVSIPISTCQGPGAVTDLSVSGDGSTVAIDGFFADPSLNAENEQNYVDWETWFPTVATGQRLNQDGSILFQLLTDGIDLIARNTGRLLYRIQIPVTPANVYDPILGADGQDSLAIITASGVSFVDLSSLPIPTGYSQPFSDTNHTRGGTLGSMQTTQPARSTLSKRLSELKGRPQLRRRQGALELPAETP
jgi:hypothetical protein